MYTHKVKVKSIVSILFITTRFVRHYAPPLRDHPCRVLNTVPEPELHEPEKFSTSNVLWTLLQNGSLLSPQWTSDIFDLALTFGCLRLSNKDLKGIEGCNGKRE